MWSTIKIVTFKRSLIFLISTTNYSKFKRSKWFYFYIRENHKNARLKSFKNWSFFLYLLSNKGQVCNRPRIRQCFLSSHHKRKKNQMLRITLKTAKIYDFSYISWFLWSKNNFAIITGHNAKFMITNKKVIPHCFGIFVIWFFLIFILKVNLQ